jgi:hypothetical protein
LESRKILIYDLKIKTGTNKNKKPYTRYAVTDEGGIEYTTFSKTYGDQFEIGKSYGIVFRFKQNDTYTSREIVEVTPLPVLENEIPVISEMGSFSTGTLGTMIARLGGSISVVPADSTSCTAVLPATSVPAPGIWLSTCPAGTVALYA